MATLVGSMQCLSLPSEGSRQFFPHPHAVILADTYPMHSHWVFPAALVQPPWQWLITDLISPQPAQKAQQLQGWDAGAV